MLPRVCFQPVSLIHFHRETAKLCESDPTLFTVVLLLKCLESSLELLVSFPRAGHGSRLFVLLVCIWLFIRCFLRGSLYTVAEDPHPPQVFPQRYYKFGRPFIFGKFDVLVL
jgi:hypothetical protein